MEPVKVARAIKILNAIDVVGLAVLLIIAFALQLVYHELPCPLCILQRIGILAITFGFLLNVRFKIHPGHYSLALLAALLTGAMSIRQIFLHIVPGEASYGMPFLGLHLYTWVFLLCVAVIIYTALIFSIFPQYLYDEEPPKSKLVKSLTHVAFALVFLLTVLNGISTYLECGTKECPENPVKYEIHIVQSHPLHA